MSLNYPLIIHKSLAHLLSSTHPLHVLPSDNLPVFDITEGFLHLYQVANKSTLYDLSKLNVKLNQTATLIL